MTHPLFAWTPTPEFWALLGLIATGVGRFCWEIAKNRNAQRMLKEERALKLAEREEDRKDLIAAAEAAAKLNEKQLKPVIEQLEAIDQKGSSRLKVLLSSNVTTRGLVKKSIQETARAVETSNGIKRDLMENGVKLITDEATEANAS